MDSLSQPPAPEKNTADLPARIHRGILIALQAIMAVELLLVFRERQWMNAFLVMAIMAVMFSPAVIGRRFHVHIPPEFQVLAVLFAFAALFLGEIHSYYMRFWWWDIALHTSSGLLMGILGFLLVYVLNADERIDIHMRPRFMALFAFLFAVTVGTLWEVFEFAMDQIVGTNMQKPMLGDPSGLTDTMWDMIVNALGALTISALGGWHMTQREQSFIEAWIRKFIERNPRLFPH
ncbi:MAG TPA: hypothetical protein VMV78_10800 [Thiobacillus sp.]|jgi:uncharacterized membrane protein YjdF|nr:hypothetical protein [Thiobacillus sp.]